MNTDLKLEIEKIKDIFKEADSKFIRTSGYIEGTLDTIISALMEDCPELAISADNLCKQFRALEGIYEQGLKQCLFNALKILDASTLNRNEDEVQEECISEALTTSANLVELINKRGQGKGKKEK